VMVNLLLGMLENIHVATASGVDGDG